MRNEHDRHDSQRPAQEAPISLPVNGQPRTLIEIVDHEALGYRAWGTPEGDSLAGCDRAGAGGCAAFLGFFFLETS